MDEQCAATPQKVGSEKGATPSQLTGGLGIAVSSPAGAEAEPRP